jgi:DNA repair protein RecN (Recombination protein N)
VPATLRSLRIRNLALVESLDWELEPGFTVVTGETGAGKSIILGALKLVLGERAEKSLIRTGADQCSVEALFALENVSEINRQLEEQGVDPCEGNELLVRRILTNAGVNRQFVNGCQTTLGLLKEVGDGLVDLHGPHDHQSLLGREYQLGVVDALADRGSLREQYRSSYDHWRKLEQELEELRAVGEAGNFELATHQLTELRAAELQPGEMAALEAKYAVAANARRLIELTALGLQSLAEGEAAISDRMEELGRTLRDLTKLDPSATQLAQYHEAAVAELAELERALTRYQDQIEIEPAELQRMEQRLNLLHSLSRKFNRSEEELIQFAAELEELLSGWDEREQRMSALAAQIEQAEAAARKLATQLSELRRQASSKLVAEVRQHLTDLGFAQAGFELDWIHLEKIGPNGADGVEFQFSPNPGEPLKPLRAIASSGEISRVMLAIKTALAQQDLIGLLVFDEIDANVGGEIAHSVGRKMQTLGKNRQVLTITHMPQVAAAARKHFLVRKEVVSGRTRTELEEVAGGSRVDEIARMLGGRNQSALEHAKVLLRGGSG